MSDLKAPRLSERLPVQIYLKDAACSFNRDDFKLHPVSLVTFRISVSKYFTNASFQVLICSQFMIIFVCLSTLHSLCVRRIVKYHKDQTFTQFGNVIYDNNTEE